jgi:TPP-dependent pyruvate/acetoin dehydrogenase alpha subunit
MASKKSTHAAAQVAGKNGLSLISDENFRALYAKLLQCTILDDRMRTVSHYERWTGREAGTAGVVACLCSGDFVTPTPRGMLARYLQNGSFTFGHEAAPNAKGQLAAATGHALRHKLERLGNVTVVFAAASEMNRTREIFAAAASQSLPVLYVLEGSARLTEVWEGLPVIRVDGSDAVAVYRVAHESIKRAREGGGATIIECAVWLGDDEPQNPLEKLEKYLTGKKIFRQDWKRRLEKKYCNALNEAVRVARMNRF